MINLKSLRNCTFLVRNRKLFLYFVICIDDLASIWLSR